MRCNNDVATAVDNPKYTAGGTGHASMSTPRRRSADDTSS